MNLKDCKPEWIEVLNKIGKQLQDIEVRIPSTQEQEEAKKIIEQILPPPGTGRVHQQYARNVLMGFEYAVGHAKSESGKSMLKKSFSV